MSGKIGFDYVLADQFKILAQQGAKQTRGFCRGSIFGYLGFSAESLGESAPLVQAGHCDVCFAHVIEGLGTKGIVADAMYSLTKRAEFFGHIAQDTVAMIVNDMITSGVMPFSIMMYLAVAEKEWFGDTARSEALVRGWVEACRLSGCLWIGGETPILSGIICPGRFDIAGSAIGVSCKGDVVGNRVQSGDSIVMFDSSGVHANGLTKCREIAAVLSPDPQKPELGYLSKLSDGRTYGEALLDPTIIYVGIIAECVRRRIDIHYAVNMTGHGWRKLMRANGKYWCFITCPPSAQPVFAFIQEHSGLSLREMYATYNMGAGFAIFVSEEDSGRVIDIADEMKVGASVVGHVAGGLSKGVEIEPLDITFNADDLQIR